MRRACTSTRRFRCPARWRAAGRWCRRWPGSSSSAAGWACPRAAEAAAQVEALDRLARQDRGEPGSLLQFVERCSLITYASSARLEQLQQDRSAAKANYPEFYGLARRLRLIAQLIKAGLSTPIYYTHLDGFDTHSGQLPQHANLLRELGASLKAFLDDLEKSGESERVVVLVFSEFGRRLGENGSGGTDHGTAAPVFLLGQPVKAGLHGALPRPDPPRGRRPDPRRRLPPRLCDPARPVAGRAASRGSGSRLRADASVAWLINLRNLTARFLPPLAKGGQGGDLGTANYSGFKSASSARLIAALGNAPEIGPNALKRRGENRFRDSCWSRS